MLLAISRRATTIGGLLLAVWGLSAMWFGWDQIQIERGWSLFIGGAAMLGGGATTAALGLVLGRLDRLVAARELREAPAALSARTEARPPAAAPQAEPAEAEPVKTQGAWPPPPAFIKKFDEPPPRAATSLVAAAPAPEPREKASAPVEVDRYVSGETTYVMFSDGAVEVRSAHGAQRFASLAELRAQVGANKS